MVCETNKLRVSGLPVLRHPYLLETVGTSVVDASTDNEADNEADKFEPVQNIQII